MFFAIELQTPGVYVSQHAVGLFDPSELVIRARKIALHGKNLFFRTLDDRREAVTTLEDTERIARRVLGSTHPTTKDIERNLRNARAKLNACEAT